MKQKKIDKLFTIHRPDEIATFNSDSKMWYDADTYKHSKFHILEHMVHQVCHVFQHNHFPVGTFHIHQLQPNIIHFPIDKWWTRTKLKRNFVYRFEIIIFNCFFFIHEIFFMLMFPLQFNHLHLALGERFNALRLFRKKSTWPFTEITEISVAKITAMIR